MDNTQVKVEFSWGGTIESAVNELMRLKKAGISAYGEFNGVTLYSDTVTMDGAYKDITGRTKAEFDKAQQECKDDYDKREREHKDSIPEQANLWMKKGREILTEDNWEYWDKIVPIRLNDLYQGMELGNCLDIVKILNEDGSFDKAKEEVEKQGHSGMSYGLVCSMIKEFCAKGDEFVEYIR